MIWHADRKGNCHAACEASQVNENDCPWARVTGRMHQLHEPTPPFDDLPETGGMDWSETKYGRPCPVRLLLLALGPVPERKRPICPMCLGVGCRVCNDTGRDFYAALQGYGDDDAPKRMTAAGLMPEGRE